MTSTKVSLPISAALIVSFTLMGTTAVRAENKEHHGTNAEQASRIIERFRKELKCDAKDAKSPYRAWCAVAAPGDKQLKLPATLTTYVGIAAEIHDGEPLPKVLDATTEPAALHLGPKTAIVSYLKPSNDAESKALMPVVFAIGNALKEGVTTPLPLPKDLVTFLDGERAKPGHALSTVGNIGHFNGKLPAEIRRVGNVYVVIETVDKGGFVSLIPVVEQTK